MLKVNERDERRAASARLEQEAVQMLGEMICDRRPALLLEFTRREAAQRRLVVVIQRGGGCWRRWRC